MRIDARMFAFIPAPIVRGLGNLPPVRRSEQVLRDLGIPKRRVKFITYPTRFDNREAERALKGSGIEVPRARGLRLALWDYWERHLDPDLFVDRSLAGAQGQGGGDHRRLVGHRRGDGAASSPRPARTVISSRAARRSSLGRGGDRGRGRQGAFYTADLADMADCDKLVARC